MLRRLIGPEIDFEIALLSRVTVLADPTQIEQVVLNLVINARDAMPDGGRLVVSITEVTLDAGMTAAEEGYQPGRHARLSVSDTGTGIDEKTRARLFEPFFTTKTQDKGTGLGLSIVYGIVKQNGGHISVVSEPGHGAVFVIDLPAVGVVERSNALV
jgi:signal transduction histidine kinase